MHRRRTFLLLSGLTLLGSPARAGLIDTLLENLRRSDFVFGRSDSNSPFPPFAWVTVEDHGESTLSLNGISQHFTERAVSQFLLAPLWIGKRDMFLVGAYAGRQHLSFAAPLAVSRDLTTVIPVVGWLRQTGPHAQLAAFAAPQYSHGGDLDGASFAEWSGYSGVVAVNWTSEEFAWAYGGVVEFTPAGGLLLPYLGCLWYPTPEWSVALIAPWPSVTYAPSRDWLCTVSVSPADATLASTDGGQNLRASYTSWNLLFSLQRRLGGNFWISAGAGWAGLGRFALTHGEDAGNDYRLKRDLVWSLSITWRPPTRGPGAVPPLAH